MIPLYYSLCDIMVSVGRPFAVSSCTFLLHDAMENRYCNSRTEVTGRRLFGSLADYVHRSGLQEQTFDVLGHSKFDLLANHVEQDWSWGNLELLEVCLEELVTEQPAVRPPLGIPTSSPFSSSPISSVETLVCSGGECDNMPEFLNLKRIKIRGSANDY
jgi:hypothetical protein